MNDFTVKVPGVDFKLSSNQIYYVREVSDSNAPDGYQKEGISKHPLPGIDSSIPVPYHEPTKTWNTGFFEGSACIVKEGAEGKSILKTIQKELLPHLNLLVEGDLTNGKSSNNALFDDFPPFSGLYGEDVSKYKIKGGNVFNTSNPLEFLALWWALIGREVIPVNKKNSSGCPFVLEDKKQSTTVSQDNEFSKTLALSTVMAVIKSKDKKELAHLQNVFEYVGLKVNLEETDTKPLIATFSKWCDKGAFSDKNSDLFNEAQEKFEEEDSREELVVYVKLVKDIKDSKVKIERRDIFIDGVNLGSDKKQAAKRIVADQELHKAFLLI